jgi:hypothetical protein
MDERVITAIDNKIDAAISKEGLEEISHIIDMLPFINAKEEFALGLIVGRVYNSFHYQTRRVLGRDANADEFNEFVSLLEARIAEIRDALKRIVY